MLIKIFLVLLKDTKNKCFFKNQQGILASQKVCAAFILCLLKSKIRHTKSIGYAQPCFTNANNGYKKRYVLCTTLFFVSFKSIKKIWTSKRYLVQKILSVPSHSIPSKETRKQKLTLKAYLNLLGTFWKEQYAFCIPYRRF